MRMNRKCQEGHNYWGNHTSFRVWLQKLEGKAVTESQRSIVRLDC